MNLRRHSLSRYIISSADPSTHFKMARGARESVGRWNVGDGQSRLGPARLSDEELTGRCVGELIALEPDAARGAAKALLTEGRSMQFALRCKDGREVKFHWNRQFDDFSTSMFII